MSCDCQEYKSKNSARCGKCNCLATVHYKIEEIPGQFEYYFKKEKFTVRAWFPSFARDDEKDSIFFFVPGVHSLTLIKTQKQVLMGAIFLGILSAMCVLAPFQTGMYLGSLFSLRFNSSMTFLTAAFLSWRTYSITSLYSKKVTCAALVFLNMFCCAAYISLSLGIFPRLSTAAGYVTVEPARYIYWLVVLPTLSHLMGDITSNDAEMKWFSRIFYTQLIGMFLGCIYPQVGLFIGIEVVSFAILSYGLNTLFHKCAENSNLAMMDSKSTMFARSMIISGVFIVQIVWMIHTLNLMTFSQMELCNTIADSILVPGLSVVICLSDMKELEVESQ